MKKIWRNRGGGKPESKRFLFIMFLFFLVSAGASYFYFKPMLSSKSSVETYSASQPEIIQKDTKEGPQRLYKSNGEDAAALSEPGLNSDSELAGAENAIKKYLEPYNTELIDLYMDSSGIIYVDMGDELKRNFKGDAAEELNIIAGLYQSIEGAVPGFRALKILINGNETETLGGHIDISMPVGGEIAGSADNI
ncbi:MAG: GerMN domain-containing protein [Nitrospirota bacterium]